MKRIFTIMLIVLAGALLLNQACRKKTIKKESNIRIMTNGADPLFLSDKLEDGKSIEFFGTRDAYGKPSKLTHILIKEGEEKFLEYNFDENSRLTRMVTDSGTELQLNWLSAKQVAIIAISKDGNYQLSTIADLDAKLRSQKHSLSVVNRKNKKIQLVWQNGAAPIAGQYKTTTNSSCYINVTRCGVPTSATVRIIVKDKNMKHLATIPATWVSDGKYRADIPNKLAPTVNLNEACNDVLEAIGHVCDFSGTEAHVAGDAICTALSAAIATTGVATGGLSVVAAAEFELACVRLNHGIELYCSTMGGSPAPGAPSIVDQLKICDAVFENRTYTEKIVLYPSIVAMPENILGTIQNVPGEGPYPDHYIDINTKTTIGGIKISPEAPLANQSYMATADLMCAKANSKVAISVIGTDGYTDKVETNLVIDEAKRTFTLTVPGAETGVNDVITVTITLLDGTVIERKTSLVFQ